MESTWEQRMAERAAVRRATSPEAIEQDQAITQARNEYLAKVGLHHLCADTPVSTVDPDVCRDCCEWLPIGNWPGVFHWSLSCGLFHRGCQHDCHDGQIWMA